MNNAEMQEMQKCRKCRNAGNEDIFSLLLKLNSAI